MAQFGRLLQFAGLVLLPLGIVLQLGNVVSLGQMLAATVFGACLFWIGRLVEGYSRK
jgi:hypothetical protein